MRGQKYLVILFMCAVTATVMYFSMTVKTGYYELHECRALDNLIKTAGKIPSSHSDYEKILYNLPENENDILSEEKLLKIKERVEIHLQHIKMRNGMKNEPKKDILDVCPEEYLGNKIGHPYYMDGFRNVKCHNSKLLEDVVSIVLLAIEVNKFIEENLKTVFKRIKLTYPTLKVYIAVSQPSIIDSVKNEMKNNTNIKQVVVDKGITEGKALMKILKNLATPYVLVARDLFNFNWFVNVHRQIRMLSEFKELVVVSGAIRNKTAHWQHGCYQSETRMHMLRYIKGYYKSFKECFFCDMVLGPFVAKTKIFKEVVLDTELKRELMYKDWFLRLKSKGFKIMTCPDIMYFASDEKFLEVKFDRTAWLPLARKWEFDYIKIGHEISHKFNCKEIGYKCQMMNTKSFILPTCCFDEMSRVLKFWLEFTEKHNIPYEIDSGSILGAVKLSDMMPWDLDGDLTVLNKDYQKIYNHREEFSDANVAVSGWRIPKCCDKDGKFFPQGYFEMGKPLYFEAFGLRNNMSTDLDLPEELIGQPTKVSVHGLIVNSPPNPGLFARNRYGKECYRHAQSWVIFGEKHSFVPYRAGQFKSCTRPNYHTCLDMHASDGSIPFNIDY